MKTRSTSTLPNKGKLHIRIIPAGMIESITRTPKGLLACLCVILPGIAVSIDGFFGLNFLETIFQTANNDTIAAAESLMQVMTVLVSMLVIVSDYQANVEWWRRRGKLQIQPWARSPVATHRWFAGLLIFMGGKGMDQFQPIRSPRRKRHQEAPSLLRHPHHQIQQHPE